MQPTHYAGKETEAENPTTDGRKPYCKPEIIHEQELETRAGSPLKLDPLGPGLGK